VTGHSSHDDLSCEVDERRRRIRREGFNGIDDVEVSDDRRRLDVYLIDRAPPDIGVGNVRLTGGRRVRDLRIVDVRVDRHDDPNVDDRIVVTVDRPGDFSTYRLCLVEADERGRPTERAARRGSTRAYACVDVQLRGRVPERPRLPPDPGLARPSPGRIRPSTTSYATGTDCGGCVFRPPRTARPQLDPNGTSRTWASRSSSCSPTCLRVGAGCRLARRPRSYLEGAGAPATYIPRSVWAVGGNPASMSLTLR